MKTYDRAYYDKWYRGPARVTNFRELRRKVTTVVANAEYFLRRPLRNVLDVGCGEAPWYVHLKALRPRVSYLGIDPSEYAVRKFSRHRQMREGSFTDLSAVTGKFDLVVCADVMHYLADDVIRTGLPRMVKKMRGLAFFEVYTKEDEIVGDLDGYNARPAKWYRKMFTSAGLTKVAPYMWVVRDIADGSSELEKCED